MSDLDDKSKVEAGPKPQPPPKSQAKPQPLPEPPQPQSQAQEGSEEAVYTYAAAGLRERKGRVPFWLWFVVVALTIWGAYYLMTYWNPPLSRQ